MKTKMLRRLTLCGLAWIAAVGCGPADDAEVGRPTGPGPRVVAFVSILPQRYFLERIGGDAVEVHVMVGPGHSPATYEPTPRQMARLSEADLYFRIRVPFEHAWMDRIAAQNPRMRIVDTTEDIQLRRIEAHHHGDHEHGHRHGHDHAHEAGAPDPHVWLDPNLVKVQARHIANALQAEDWQNAQVYQQNLARFLDDLERVDREIRDLLRDVENRVFMVFHPAWGYFADAYGFEQIPIEYEGKSPGARTIAALIDRAQREGIGMVIVQKQFSARTAEAIAEAAGLRVVSLDPLAVDYLENLKRIAAAIAGGGGE